MSSPALVVRRCPLAKLPTGIADKIDHEAKQVARRIMDRRQEIRESLGSRPLGGAEIDESTALGNYLQLRHNRFGWAEIVQSHTRLKEDGTVVMRKELMETVKKFEKQIQEGSQ